MFSDRDPPEPQSQFRVMILLKKSFILLVAAFSAGPPRVYEHCYVFFGYLDRSSCDSDTRSESSDGRFEN